MCNRQTDRDSDLDSDSDLNSNYLRYWNLDEGRRGRGEVALLLGWIWIRSEGEGEKWG
jgi:hypothetical protein